jgi:hypothetical protein
MSLLVPTGYFYDKHAVWGDPAAGSILSRFYAIDFPDTSASDDSVLTALENDIRLMLGCLKPDERLQMQYYTASDFGAALDRYAAEQSEIGICNEVRAELVQRYRDRMNAETLIQANVRLCLSTRMPKLVNEGGLAVRGFDDVFKVLSRSFEQRAQFFNLLLSSYAGSVNGLDNAGHYEELLKFWSPGQARQPRFTDLDWLRPIDDLCRFSGLAPRHEPDHGFYMDGYYFGVIVAKTLPRSTWAKTMEPFLALTIPNLRVVLNMEPLPIDAEMRHEEERFSKLASNVDLKSPSLESEVGMDKHRDRMRLLMSNKVIPFRAQLIVIACDRTRDGLDARIEAVRAALGKTGCEPWQPSVATSTIAFFNCATPGVGPWVKHRDFWHKMDDAVNVANMWPAGSTPRADLDSADWIADGHLNNLIGGRCFIGAQPLHMLVAATTGAGKSVLLQTLALQTAPQFKFMVVIDDGLSWMTTCRKLDPSCWPIIVRSNGDQTFNIFDTRRQPLSNQHLASATALVHLLVGQHADQDKDKLRHAVIAETIQAVYGSAFRRWRKNYPAEYYEIGLGLDDSPKSEEYIQSIALSRWSPEMFPTLFDLQDELHAAATQKGPHQELCATLASLLRPWLRDGIYGPIVDGASNIDLGSTQMSETDPLKVVHFELGEMGESEKELKAVVGFLITNEVRNHIQGLPRGLRKQVVIEEMVSFLKVPNAEEIIVDYWQKMRKYNAQMVAVFQNYSTLLEASPKVAKAIVSNSSALMLLRNHNRKDLEALSEYLPRPIPEVIKDHITRFPKPNEFANRDEAYAGFVYVQLGNEEPRYTVGRNYISDEVEQITSSSGDAFESKKAELKKVIKMENVA